MNNRDAVRGAVPANIRALADALDAGAPDADFAQLAAKFADVVADNTALAAKVEQQAGEREADAIEHHDTELEVERLTAENDELKAAAGFEVPDLVTEIRRLRAELDAARVQKSQALYERDAAREDRDNWRRAAEAEAQRKGPDVLAALVEQANRAEAAAALLQLEKGKLHAEVKRLTEESERESLELVGERDYATDWADKLATAIASHTGVDIGEHSNANEPWPNALQALADHAAPAPPIDLGGQTDAYRAALRAHLDEQCGPNEICSAPFNGDCCILAGLAGVEELLESRRGAARAAAPPRSSPAPG